MPATSGRGALLVLGAVLLTYTSSLEARTYRLYYLGGESKMGGCGYSDKWHYDSAGTIDLGRQFAEALISLHGGATPGDED